MTDYLAEEAETDKRADEQRPITWAEVMASLNSIHQDIEALTERIELGRRDDKTEDQGG